jgi:hypothetical protein
LTLLKHLFDQGVQTMPGGVNSVTDIIGVDNLEVDVTRNVRTEPGSVQNEKPADAGRTANNEKALPVTAEAGGRERGADATADTTKQSDPDADVSLALTVPHATQAEVEHYFSWLRSGAVQRPGLRKRTRL